MSAPSTHNSRLCRLVSFFLILCCFAGGLEAPFAPGEDCNRNGVPDADDIASAASHDCNQNGVPDECEPLFPGQKENLVGSWPNFIAASDSNGDGRIDLSDPVSILGFLFHGARPPALGTECVWIAGCPDVCQ
jgi:hypothetical protein